MERKSAYSLPTACTLQHSAAVPIQVYGHLCQASLTVLQRDQLTYLCLIVLECSCRSAGLYRETLQLLGRPETEKDAAAVTAGLNWYRCVWWVFVWGEEVVCVSLSVRVGALGCMCLSLQCLFTRLDMTRGSVCRALAGKVLLAAV